MLDVQRNGACIGRSRSAWCSAHKELLDAYTVLQSPAFIVLQLAQHVGGQVAKVIEPPIRTRGAVQGTRRKTGVASKLWVHSSSTKDRVHHAEGLELPQRLSRISACLKRPWCPSRGCCTLGRPDPSA